ncbi:SRPBCC family protein [Sediminivirga luteola]|uniref:Polyketide cyclase n=1 Tax=Sediminivirga luteola TaxID=1774748 RepID=A0A8J2TVD8_9MICO|nr:SRPBCC family protein [Sediminivirga luteola]MCI2265899.1 SRPBCC family protein [Sediminivirga luteola]GGA03952.1 hypothetical protein GCM10011333_03420 [Sediminivirga luteola]
MFQQDRPFRFTSVWTVPAPPERVWEILSDADSWPSWWPGVSTARTVRTAGDQDDPTGTRVVLTVRSPLGYRLRFRIELTGAERPRRASMSVSGDLHGTGRWEARPDPARQGRTRIVLLWHVGSRRRLVRATGRLARGAHRLVMTAGERGLRRRLRTRG